MTSKITHYTFLFLSIILFTFSCSKQEKNDDGIVKINKNGIPVMQPLQEELPALTAAYINDKKSLHKANKLLKISTEEKIKNILTPEQFAKFKSIKETLHKEKILARADSMASSLGLSAEQKEKFKILIAERNNKLQENKKLYSGDLEKMKIANKEVKKSFKSNLATLLTPDQLTLYKSKQKARQSQK